MGLITSGNQERHRPVARALDYGEVVFDDKPDAMAAPEKGRRKWFEERGIEVE